MSTCTSRYPDARYNKDGLPRSTTVAVPRTPSHGEAGLAASLYPYVCDDDIPLDRRSFLEMVRDRIDMDLLTGEY